MQKLHLVGFTPDLDGLILSTRKGAKKGTFVVPVDANLLKLLGDVARGPEPAGRSNGARHGGAPRQTRPDSQLGPREMQELLRGGWTLEEVAVEAGVDVDWVSRFAAPVMAELRLVLDQGRACVFDKPRVGPSALPLAPSVRRNVAERGVRFTDESFEAGWTARQLDDELWVVSFEYTSRGKKQLAEWTLDLGTGDLTSRGRLATQLGHVQSTRRRVSIAPPPKPKPKAAATRAVARPPAVQAPARRAVPAPVPATRNRARQSGTRSPSAGAKKAPGDRTPTPPAPATSGPPRHDPWREELRRREAERPAPPPSPPAPSAIEPEAEPPMVAVIGPTVRTLTRRPVERPEPAPAPPRPAPRPQFKGAQSANDPFWPQSNAPGRVSLGPEPSEPAPAEPAPAEPTVRVRRRSEPLRAR